MFYHLLYPLQDFLSFFNIFKYITFRSVCGFVTSFLLVIFLGKWFIGKLKRMRVEEHIDMYGHLKLETIYNGKKGTPTMGGVLILVSIFISLLLWSRWDNSLVWIVSATTIWFGVLGLLDDYLKLKRKKGLTRISKLFLQVLFGTSLGIFLFFSPEFSTKLYFPFFKNLVVELGIFYILWTGLVITSCCNAVNFTDGLDGLAIGTVCMVALVFSIFSYLAGHIKFSSYLFIPYVRGAGELAVLCSGIVGAGLGFLWFNAQPAEMFMGNVGSSFLGALLGCIALLIKQEFVLLVGGGIFVLEAFSVFIQILSVRVRGRRVFKAAPLHHHFQILGWADSKITIRFWILSSLFSALALAMLKLR